MRAASASIRRLPRALVRWEHAGGSGQGSASAKFGRNVAKEDSAAQNLSDIGRGRYDYIYDFMSSMQKGPVKLDFGDRAPTKKELEQVCTLPCLICSRRHSLSCLVGVVAV